MSSLLPSFRTALQTFASSSSTLQILRTVPASSPPPSLLFILDSSFNPPTTAHLRICHSALLSTRLPSRLLLLLATRNADKPPAPAPFEHRLAMMTLFASELLSTLSQHSPLAREVAVDIGITKLPYFIDKSAAIACSGLYPSPSPEVPLEQIHLIGYDTLVRVLDPKYYPPTHTLAALDPLFAHHRLRVAYRAGDSWGAGEEQDKYLADLREGKGQGEGWRMEWAERIEMVEKEEEGRKVSSTRVREAVGKGQAEVVRDLCGEGVGGYVLGERLYEEEEEVES